MFSEFSQVMNIILPSCNKAEYYKKNRSYVYENTILNPLAFKTGDLMYIDNFQVQSSPPGF